MSTCVVVESPSKAKTLKGYLGKGYTILASYGHVRDLRPKTGAIEPDNNFKMHYEAIDRNTKHLEAIEKALKKCNTLLLATDPDREGEAIAWHILEHLKSRKTLTDKHTIGRVAFHQITKKAVKDAVDHPRDIDMSLVNAQQTRRGLDYLVGFYLSPLLWKKVRRGLSAGRVQSPALNMIVKREEEIEAFKPREYWHIEANCQAHDVKFIAKLHTYQAQKLDQFSIENEAQNNDWLETLKGVKPKIMQVDSAKTSPRKRQPPPPFTTSTLQQDGANKLGFTTSRTMRTAQQLYEGISLGKEQVGLITYMRTDSVTIAEEAIGDIRSWIEQAFDAKHLSKDIRRFKTKSKNAQEAHEAIRVTDVARTPEDMKTHLDSDQFKLYQLIWRRTVATQMIEATFQTSTVMLDCGKIALFKATGSYLQTPGFLTLYKDQKPNSEDEDKSLPPLKEGEDVDYLDITGIQHFTEPPPRYSEATLVKELEEHGIGRPSTYASIISTLQAREYALLEKKRFHPTDVGRIVSKFLANHFQKYVDYDFTASLEDQLDAIARNEQEWLPMLEAFWGPFHKQIDTIDQSVKREDVTHEALDEKCPECKSQLSIRLGKRGRFIGCTNYPECRYTRPLEGDNDDEQPQDEAVNRDCPKCSNPLVYKHGRFGKFIGCSNYPECRHIESLNPPKDTNVSCPKCKEGTIQEKRSKRGKVFYACNQYPKCRYAIWNEPLDEACPKCKWPILTLKETKKHGKQKICPQEDCDYSVNVDDNA